MPTEVTGYTPDKTSRIEKKAANLREVQYAEALSRLTSLPIEAAFPAQVTDEVIKHIEDNEKFEKGQGKDTIVVTVDGTEFIIDLLGEKLTCVYQISEEDGHRRVTKLVYCDATTNSAINIVDLQPEVPIYMGEPDMDFLMKTMKIENLGMVSYEARFGGKYKRRIGSRVYINIPEKNPTVFKEKTLAKIQESFDASGRRFGYQLPGHDTYQRLMNLVGGQNNFEGAVSLATVLAPAHEYAHAIELHHHYHLTIVKRINSVIERSTKEMSVRDERTADAFALQVLDTCKALGVDVYRAFPKEEMIQWCENNSRRQKK